MTTVRATHLGSYFAQRHRIADAAHAVSKAQTQIASGKRILRPADDPASMSRVLELKAALRMRQQERRNADDGLMWVNLADSKLQGAVEQIQRARELAVRAGSTVGDTERVAIAAEVASVRDGLVAIANTRHQGRGLFAGFATGDAVQHTGTGWVYQGDAGTVDRRIGENEVVTVNVTADSVFGFSAGRDTFTMIDDLEAAVLGGDVTAVNAALADMDQALQHVLGSLAALGATGNRIELGFDRIQESTGTLQSQLGTLEDVDLAEAIMHLQLGQTQYEAALAAFARTSQASLLDFLR